MSARGPASASGLSLVHKCIGGRWECVVGEILCKVGNCGCGLVCVCTTHHIAQ